MAGIRREMPPGLEARKSSGKKGHNQADRWSPSGRGGNSTDFVPRFGSSGIRPMQCGSCKLVKRAAVVADISLHVIKMHIHGYMGGHKYGHRWRVPLWRPRILRRLQTTGPILERRARANVGTFISTPACWKVRWTWDTVLKGEAIKSWPKVAQKVPAEWGKSRGRSGGCRSSSHFGC
jgi:hypothetical protein